MLIGVTLEEALTIMDALANHLSVVSEQRKGKKSKEKFVDSNVITNEAIYNLYQNVARQYFEYTGVPDENGPTAE